MSQPLIQSTGRRKQAVARVRVRLNEAEGDPVILATSNHVCMMQWNSARWGGMVRKPFDVRHVIQLLDPETE